MKTKLVLLLTVSFLAKNIHCMVMTKTRAILATALSTSTVAGLSAYSYKHDLKYFLENGAHYDWYKKYLAQPALRKCITSTALVGIASGIFFARKTPQGLLLIAKYKINELNKDVLKIVQNKKPDEINQSINSYYIQCALPKVEAFQDLGELLRTSNTIVSLLNKAKKFPEDSEVVSECDKYLLEFTDEYFQNIKDCMLFVKNEAEFLKQFKAQQLENNARANQMNAMANTVNATANTFRYH